VRWRSVAPPRRARRRADRRVHAARAGRRGPDPRRP
jgi:hypothetical protein